MRWAALCAGLLPALSACHLWHLTQGQVQLLMAREPIPELLADPATEPRLRARLQLSLKLRRFAIEQLALPDNGSYAQYADLGRPYAVWNVFAAPEFSVQPKTWCWPLVGCLAYRGYFDVARAQAFAAELRAEGFDTYIGPVAAYSTLGWFADPVLNTMNDWSDEQFAALIFHELAHQRVFARGDTEFNESYASFVADQGLSAWLGGDPGPLQRAQRARQMQAEFVALIDETRQALQTLYAQGLPVPERRRAKARAFAALKARYRQWRDSRWPGDRRYDAFFEQELNNATLIPVAIYGRWVSAFARLFEQSGGDWARFHRAVEELAALEAEARQQRLQALAR